MHARRALVLGLAIASFSCNKGTEPTEVATTKVAFYGSFAPSVMLPVTVSVDGVQVGAIDGTWSVPPGNCSADYTAKTTIPRDGKGRDWNARSANGLANAGVIRATAASPDCMVVKVF